MPNRSRRSRDGDTDGADSGHQEQQNTNYGSNTEQQGQLGQNPIERVGSWLAELFGIEKEREVYSSGGVEVAGPFATGVTRGDFVWAAAIERPELKLGKWNRDEVLSEATRRGILSGGHDDGLNRADAATIMVRLFELSQDLPAGLVAYFYDVPPGVYYHETAHAARRHGLFMGGGDNMFRPGDGLSVAEAQIVIERTGSLGILSPDDQTNGATPMLEPNAALGLLQEEELEADDIGKVRDAIARMPEDEQANLYRQLSGKVTYRNQRDNAGKYVIGDYMCNVTSIAMALNQLGIGADEDDKQFEDLLDEKMVEGQMGSRYGQTGQSNVAKAFGAADVERVWAPAFGSSEDAEKWFNGDILPRLQKGESATMSIITADTPDGHIVRLEWVDVDGLKVDDPFGALYFDGASFRYNGNDRDSEEEQGAKGEDNKWSWETVATVAKGRYVQFYGTAGANLS